MKFSKEQMEIELNAFFASCFGNAFKRCHLATDVSEYQISTIDLPSQQKPWLELGEVLVLIELTNGNRFEIGASEWLQIQIK